MQSKGREAVYFSCPFRPAWGRKGYNKQCCKNARRMRWTSRDNANARRMRRPPRDGEQHALSASPRNGDAKGPWHVHTAVNAGKSLSYDPRATAARLCTCRYRSCKGVAQTRIECNAPAKETARTRYRTSVEQRSALPLKGVAVPAVPGHTSAGQCPPPLKGSRTVSK